MAREDCALCKGTGWKLVPRKDGAVGQMAVACECGMEARAETLRALRFRKLRNRPCRWQDLDHATRTSVEAGKIDDAGFCAGLPGYGKRLAADGAIGGGQDAFGSSSAEGIDPPRT